MVSRSKSTKLLPLRGGVTGQGFDVHPENINRKGRPTIAEKQREFDEALARILGEEIQTGKGKKKKKHTELDNTIRRVLHNRNPRGAIDLLFWRYGKAREFKESEILDNEVTDFKIPADLIGPAFLNAYRSIINHEKTEYLFYGGRGSLKSSFVSLAIIYLIKNNPLFHAVITRQVKGTMRDSVYAQMLWAIDLLGANHEFKCMTNPMQIEYLPTGQVIFFRGADDAGKLKSIKPPFGYIAILWFEELDQFYGPESVRKIEQSVIRGGDIAYIFKSWNPPRTSGSWVNKYVKIPKDTQFQHSSTYLDAPIEWIGKTFVEEAEFLKQVNPDAYENEYMGIANGVGSQVFPNVVIKTLSDEEVNQFDDIKCGLDFGFYPDPAHYLRMHYDAARLTLYIFNEVRKLKTSNEEMYKLIKKEGGYSDGELMIADSAEPKSIGDYRAYGANCRGAIKGKDSVKYSMKWLQSLKAIVIDPKRCPYAAEEFTDYAFPEDKDGDLITEYPDKNDHSISAARYGTSLIWKVRGQ